MTNIYIDENFAEQLAEGLNIFQIHLNKKAKENFKILSIKKEFGKGAKDEDWIPKISDAIIITQDYGIQRTQHQYELYRKYNLGIFFIKPPSKGYTFWEMLEQLIKRLPEIKNLSTTNKPFAYKCTQKSKFKLLS